MTAPQLVSSPVLQQLKAPTADRTLLLAPGLDELVWPLPGRPGERASLDLGGRSLHELTRAARKELIAAAGAWTGRYRQTATPDAEAPVVLAGHQAELFHPGVWAKNFVLHRLAAEHGATAINLVVDTDILKRTSIRVPGGSPAEPELTSVAFDKPLGGELPTEARPIGDLAIWESFPQRVHEAAKELLPSTLLPQFWPLVVERSRAGVPLGPALAQARHRLEGEWGLQTLEVPLSATCQTESFCWFAAHLLAGLPRFAEVFNRAVLAYRRRQKLRSTRHPFPELEADGHGLEAPFWIWTADRPLRRRLFVRHSPDGLELSDRGDFQRLVPTPSAENCEPAASALLALMREGVCLRTRAVTTTIWARVFLSDLFIHGLGGAKYDQVTDEVVRRFYGLEPPAFLTATATLRLPIPRLDVAAADVRQFHHALRRLDWNPQDYLADHAPADSAVGRRVEQLIAEKWHWVQTPQDAQNAKQRFQSIRQINEQLQSPVEPRRQVLASLREELAAIAATQRHLASRDYAFCLYPEDLLREFLAGEVAGL